MTDRVMDTLLRRLVAVQRDVERLKRVENLAPLMPEGGGGTAVGLGNNIYLWPADGGTILQYAPTQAGLIAALAAAVAGDTVILPSIPIALTAGVTLITGTTLMGLSEASILNFSGFAGTAITLAASAICDHFVFNFTPSADNSIGMDARFEACIVNHVRGHLIGTLPNSVCLRVGVS